MEQSRSLADTLIGRLNLELNNVNLEGIPYTREELRDFKKVLILACGTAYHAALAGKYIFEQVARIP